MTQGGIAEVFWFRWFTFSLMDQSIVFQRGSSWWIKFAWFWDSYKIQYEAEKQQVPFCSPSYTLLPILFFPLTSMEILTLFWTEIIFFKKIYLFIYLFLEMQREREAETEAEREAGSMQRAWHGTRHRVSRITPWAAEGHKPLWHWGCPMKTVCIQFLVRIQEQETWIPNKKWG